MILGRAAPEEPCRGYYTTGAYSCFGYSPGISHPFEGALSAKPWPCSFGLTSRAGRKPMFVFEFDRGLFKFNAARPALEPLFQLPPRYGRRFVANPLHF